MRKFKNVESQCMMTVMSDLVDRINCLQHVPQKAQTPLLDALREGRCLNSAELLREHWRWEQLYGQAMEVRDSRQDEMASQICVTIRALCRDLTENPVSVKILCHNDSGLHNQSEELQRLLQALSELTDLTHAQLDKTLEGSRSKEEIMVVAEKRVKQANDERLILLGQLAEIRKVKEEQVALLAAQVQKLHTELLTINNNASHELMIVETDLKEAQMLSFDRHSEEIKQLVDETSALELRVAKMAQEHQEKEEGLRKHKCKKAVEVAAFVEKYDNEMDILEAELQLVEKTFRQEREQCAELEDHFHKIDKEQSLIDSEEQVLDGIRAQEREAQLMIYNAATCIQRICRGILCRRKYRKSLSKKKRVGKKGVKKGVKKGKKK